VDRDGALGGQADQLLPDGGARAGGRDRERHAEGADDRALAGRVGGVVVDQDADRARGDGVAGLVLEEAGPALDEGDVARGEPGEVGGLAAGVGRVGVDDADRGGDVTVAAEVEGAEVAGGAGVGGLGVGLRVRRDLLEYRRGGLLVVRVVELLLD
jgi:hypothetical protein